MKQRLTNYLKKFGCFHSWVAIFLLYAGVIYYLALRPIEVGHPMQRLVEFDKIIHAGEFTLFFLIGKRVTHYTKITKAREYIALILVSLAFGGIMELSQMFVSYRSASVIDWLADFGGVILGYTITKASSVLEKPSKKSS